jgi:protein tyrosine phosphatase (PTP) superfamily phosphohydrolase (DUF442 family)
MTPITSAARIASAALVLAACACGPSSAAPAAPVASVNASVIPSAVVSAPVTLADGSAVPIANFARVDAGYFRGAQPDQAGFRALRALGVRTVVNLREAHSDATRAAPEGIELVEIPLHAYLDSDPPTEDEVRAFFDVVLDPAKRPVFVHCAQGKDRTGTMSALYRMEVDGWSPDRAFAEMQSFGFHDWYADLEAYVKGYTPRFAEKVRAFAGAR